jgi:hypothetical protein
VASVAFALIDGRLKGPAAAATCSPSLAMLLVWFQTVLNQAGQVARFSRTARRLSGTGTLNRIVSKGRKLVPGYNFDDMHKSRLEHSNS